MRIREFFDRVISFNPSPCNSLGFAPNYSQDDLQWKISKISQFLTNFAVTFEPRDSYTSEYNINPELYVWSVKCPRAELHMKFSGLCFNPPGGVIGDTGEPGYKVLLWWRDLAIAILPDIIDPMSSIVVLTTLDAKVTSLGFNNGTSY